MEIIEEKDNKLKFKAKITENLANAMRRYVGEIPTLAIDDVEIHKNDSAMYDETLAHRIGLVPLKTLKSYNSKTELPLKISTKKEGLVLAEELKGEAEVIFPEIPLVLLNKGQELDIIATARLGKGVDHSKYSPGILFYRNLVEIKVDKDAEKLCLENCPKGVFSSENGKLKIDEIQCDMCEACVDACNKAGKKEKVEITPTDELIIEVESFGQISSKDIVLESIKELKKDLSSISKKI